MLARGERQQRGLVPQVLDRGGEQDSPRWFASAAPTLQAPSIGFLFRRACRATTSCGVAPRRAAPPWASCSTRIAQGGRGWAKTRARLRSSLRVINALRTERDVYRASSLPISDLARRGPRGGRCYVMCSWSSCHARGADARRAFRAAPRGAARRPWCGAAWLRRGPRCPPSAATSAAMDLPIERSAVPAPALWLLAVRVGGRRRCGTVPPAGRRGPSVRCSCARRIAGPVADRYSVDEREVVLLP